MDLITLPKGLNFGQAAKNMAENCQAITAKVRAKIEKSNARYKEAAYKNKKERLFEIGDQVMVFLRKERFPIGMYGK